MQLIKKILKSYDYYKFFSILLFLSPLETKEILDNFKPKGHKFGCRI